MTAAIASTPGVASVQPAGVSDTGLTQWTVVLNAAPATSEAFKTVDALRDSVRGSIRRPSSAGRTPRPWTPAHRRAGPEGDHPGDSVGGAGGALSAAAGSPCAAGAHRRDRPLDAGRPRHGQLGQHPSTGVPALDNTTPLFAFLFLVALGVDYTIFLVTRAKEETPMWGTRGGIVRAVSATGAVITSAGLVLAAVFCVLGCSADRAHPVGHHRRPGHPA